MNRVYRVLNQNCRRILTLEVQSPSLDAVAFTLGSAYHVGSVVVLAWPRNSFCVDWLRIFRHKDLLVFAEWLTKTVDVSLGYGCRSFLASNIELRQLVVLTRRRS